MDAETEAVLESLATPEKITLEMTALEAFTLVGNLQLALRHPANKGESAALAKDIALALIGVLPEPARELSKKGWDPAYDVPRN